MSAMIHLTKELPQHTTVIQSEHNGAVFKKLHCMRHLEAVYDIRSA